MRCSPAALADSRNAGPSFSGVFSRVEIGHMWVIGPQAPRATTKGGRDRGGSGHPWCSRVSPSPPKIPGIWLTWWLGGVGGQRSSLPSSCLWAKSSLKEMGRAQVQPPPRCWGNDDCQLAVRGKGPHKGRNPSLVPDPLSGLAERAFRIPPNILTSAVW
jgi:hypothetical protein